MLKFYIMMLFMFPLLKMSSMSLWMVSIIMIMSSPIIMLFYMNSTSYYMLSSWVAMDMMSLTLIIMTIWITAMMLIASIKIFNMSNSSNNFMLCCLTLMIILMLCFSSPNMIMFYIWFEASLIPTMTLIMLWGYQPERLQASMYLIIYTVTASLPMLMFLLKLINYNKSSLMPMYNNINWPPDFTMMKMAWMMMMGGFLVKLPMFMVHLWLPKAHVEAPVAGSMVLAAILLKLGGYGILRLNFMLNNIPHPSSNMMLSISLVGAIMTSMICMRQTDLKSLIAYSSIGHMGLMLAGAMSGTGWGFKASLAMMISHALSSSALFAMANMNYEMLNTRSLFLTKGLMLITPTLTLWWFLFIISNMACPPSINLMSEILLISSIMSLSMKTMVMISMASFLTGAYSLYLYSSMNHGNINMFSNAFSMSSSSNYLMSYMHLFPIVILILSPSFISSWL